MLTWDGMSKWGRRASDTGATLPAAPRRDLMLEGAIAHEQVDVLFQPLIEPATGRVVGAEALARSPIADGQLLFARASAGGLEERLSRLVQRKALRNAAAWEGALKDLGLSINILPADISREGYDTWLLDEIRAAGFVQLHRAASAAFRVEVPAADHIRAPGFAEQEGIAPLVHL